MLVNIINYEFGGKKIMFLRFFGLAIFVWEDMCVVGRRF